jgi:hypothetical protein
MTHKQVSNLTNRQMRKMGSSGFDLLLKQKRVNPILLRNLFLSSDITAKRLIVEHLTNRAKKGDAYAKSVLKGMTLEKNISDLEPRMFAWASLWEIAVHERKGITNELLKNAIVGSTLVRMDTTALEELKEVVSKRIKGGDKRLLSFIAEKIHKEPMSSGQKFGLITLLVNAAEKGSKEAAFEVLKLADQKDPNSSAAIYKAISKFAQEGMKEALPVLIQGVPKFTNQDIQTVFIKEGLEAFAKKGNKAAKSALKRIKSRGEIRLEAF